MKTPMLIAVLFVGCGYPQDFDGGTTPGPVLYAFDGANMRDADLGDFPLAGAVVHAHVTVRNAQGNGNYNRTQFTALYQAASGRFVGSSVLFDVPAQEQPGVERDLETTFDTSGAFDEVPVSATLMVLPLYGTGAAKVTFSDFSVR